MDSTTDKITKAIVALRMKLTPSSITPKDVADILQAIFNFVQALSLAPQSEILDLNNKLTQALNAATAAQNAANTAVQSANDQHVTLFEPEQGSSGVIIKLKQAGSATLQLSVPMATALKAGLLSKEMFAKINEAKEKADDTDIDNLDYADSAIGIQLKIVKHNGEVVDCDIMGATVEKAGLLTAADKKKLDDMPGTEQVAMLEASGAMKSRHAPYTLLRNVVPTVLDDGIEIGDNYFDAGHIYHAASSGDPIDLGVPSREITYCHADTGALYRWDGTRFTPCSIAPEMGLQLQNVRAFSASSKRYDIPAGVLAIVKPTTDTANINLLAGVTGRAAVHRIIIEKADAASIVEEEGKGLRWMQTLLWENANPPTLQDINYNAGIVVTIYNRRYGSFYVIEDPGTIRNQE